MGKRLHHDIKTDVWSYRTPVVVFGNTSYYPGWREANVTHAISIVGYDDNAGTYMYVDTCSYQCGAPRNGGIYTIPQHTLFLAIQNAKDSYGNLTGGIVWQESLTNRGRERCREWDARHAPDHRGTKEVDHE